MKSCFLLRGRPRVARGCPVDGRMPGSLHFYRAKFDGQIDCIFTIHAGTFAHNPLQKCTRSVLRTAKAFPKDSAASFPFQRAPWVLARAPGKSFAIPRWPPRWPPARIPAFLRCPVASSQRAEKFHKKSFEVDNLFSKSRLQNRCRSTARIAACGGVIVNASTGSIANHRAPWH